MTLYATILAGGSGTRFWPQSRATRPKQFLVLQGKRSLLQATADRIAPLCPPERTVVVTADALCATTRAQLPQLPPENVLGEPQGRNTAAAVGLAALHLLARDAAAIMAVFPADHVIADAAALCQSVQQAAAVAQQHGLLMTLGVAPTYAATGYGYIEVGPLLATPGVPRAHRVTRFVEKPDAETAARLLASGRYLWNSGIFVWQAATIAEALATHLPKLWQGLQAYVAAARQGESAAELAARYRQLPSLSIDQGVLERSARVGVVPVRFGWSDVGSWRALGELYPPDAEGNVVVGQHVGHDSSGLIVYSPDRLVATIGVRDLIVVHAGDVVLVCPKDRDQEVRQLVEALRARGAQEYL
ncbi:MAG: mannose-1-phosphate guanylyltransferase [Candidatus Tectimicrobiota bacterium]|nr:MAG: mannose-1-phosphate guanylyltransferase [Candidatus Tectomicrobia bacterium]